MGAAGVGDQCAAGATAAGDQFVEFVLAGFEARGLDIGGIHGGRQVEGDDQRGTVLHKPRAVLFPGGARRRDGAEDQQGGGQMHRAQAMLVLRGNQQVRQQVRGNDRPQPALLVMAAAP